VITLSPSEWFQLAQALASIATVVLVILTWQQIRLVRKQATTTFEDNLTAQYRRIMESIPTDIWLGSQLKTLSMERQSQCRDAIYRYIDLSNEQAFLHAGKRVTDEAWNEWRKGIKGNMELPAFKQVWAEVAEKCPDNFKELRSALGPVAKG
jgi:hypothetical protein